MGTHTGRARRDVVDDDDELEHLEFPGEDESESGDDLEDMTPGSVGVASDMLPADAERMLAATLALMTSFYRCPHTALCRKLMDNLAMLSRHPDLSDPLKMVCRNAEARWASYLEEVEQAIAEVGELDCEDEEDTPPTTIH
jgi:hypothetical protein